MQNTSNMAGTGGGSKSGGEDRIEKIDQKESQLEHILLHPDTYIGTVENTTELMWIYNEEKKKMVQKEINFVPGLYKIFDEILVNAADNKDKEMSCIRIDIDAGKNTISIWNNGKGIPVVMHKDEKMYEPTRIFGHLLTSSNYNDEEEKVTGGHSGYGVKLCNIFSTSFIVETASNKHKKSFQQVWKNNMTEVSEPKIKNFSGSDYTKVTFSPDLSKFKMERLDDDIVALMSRRAYDVAASKRGVSVFLNKKKLPVKNFQDYIDLYLKEYHDKAGNPLKFIYNDVNKSWEVAVAPSQHGFHQVSFVNSIATTKGGGHVDHVVDSIVQQVIEVLKKKNKGINIEPCQVRNNIWVFINCLIVNPTFDSQTKENMTLQENSFVLKCALPKNFIESVVDLIESDSELSWAKFKAQNDLAKPSGKNNKIIEGIPILEDANECTTNSELCTLILTVGYSAKSLAISGLSVVGRDHYGVFPLHAKLLNVLETTHRQILDNVEIKKLIKIIGLQCKKKYLNLDDLKTLRYGKVMIMAGRDQYGSHIKGLLINFFHTNWPELLRLPFLEQFITPIIKAIDLNKELSFYSLPEFEKWKSVTPNHNTYDIKHYEGLGTFTPKEVKEYFQNMEQHRIKFEYSGEEDDDHIALAYAKNFVDQRKEWLTEHMANIKHSKLSGLPEIYLYAKDKKHISYTEFVNFELLPLFTADNVRSIPCLMDGFKPCQRKVMFTCFKRNDKRQVNVAQLAVSVAEMSAYYGEMSRSLIANLAQNFISSNNINLLEPRGQFGTRLAGGKDLGSPRDLFTLMSPLTRLIFHPHDDPLLEYKYDNNAKIEPVWYIPIIPMILVNGTEGIGTGWTTKIPNYNPRQIISYLRHLLSNEEPETLHPWYKSFKGSIEYISKNRYLSYGNVAIINDEQIEITELPVGTWTQTYKENVLEPLLYGYGKIKPIINDYIEYNTDTTVRFVISFAPGEFKRLCGKEGGFHRVFKLSSSISTGQMHAFDHVNRLRRFDSAIEILKEYFTLRLEYYHKRKAYLEGQLCAQADLLKNQARFILEKCENILYNKNEKPEAVINELIRLQYKPDPIKEWQRKIKLEKKEPIDDDENEDVKNFDYLLSIKVFTNEKSNDLLNQHKNKLDELKKLKAKTPEKLWLEDLKELEEKLIEIEDKEDKERLEELNITANEIFPTKNSIEVQFKVTDDLIKQFEKADKKN